jgi:lipopolysaccharide/colanic/teichoic acid biosynthesis glycosyltransferase
VIGGESRYDRIKRGIDLVVAALLLVGLLPGLLTIGLLVLVTLGRPVLFRQQRPGRGGELFTLVRFRTMCPAEPALGPGDRHRLTKLGRLLRATGMDELPTLWNVLRGHMSLVGPRPLLPAYLGRYTPQQARRHEIRPGITGLAQVHGCNELSWPEQLAYDVWYVDHRSLGLDLQILARTGWTVLCRPGIISPGCATAREFRPTAALTAADRVPEPTT